MDRNDQTVSLKQGKYIYNSQDKIGSGQYGIVYQGKNTISKMQIAIKKYDSRKFRSQPKLYDQIQLEIQALETIKADINTNSQPDNDDIKYVLQYHEAVQEDQSIFIIMQLCTGYIELQDIKHSLSQSEAHLYIFQIMKGLRYMQTRQMAHRDLKPTNILVNQTLRRIKIIDFGFSRASGRSGMEFLATSYVGSPLYMAPQILSMESYNLMQCDIWSLGIIAYQLLCRQMPWDEIMSMEQLLFRVQQHGEKVMDLHFQEGVDQDSIQFLSSCIINNQNERATLEQLFQMTPFKEMDLQGAMNNIVTTNDAELDQIQLQIDPDLLRATFLTVHTYDLNDFFKMKNLMVEPLVLEDRVNFLTESLDFSPERSPLKRKSPESPATQDDNVQLTLNNINIDVNPKPLFQLIKVEEAKVVDLDITPEEVQVLFLYCVYIANSHFAFPKCYQFLKNNQIPIDGRSGKPQEESVQDHIKIVEFFCIELCSLILSELLMTISLKEDDPLQTEKSVPFLQFFVISHQSTSNLKQNEVKELQSRLSYLSDQIRNRINQFLVADKSGFLKNYGSLTKLINNKNSNNSKTELSDFLNFSHQFNKKFGVYLTNLRKNFNNEVEAIIKSIDIIDNYLQFLELFFNFQNKQLNNDKIKLFSQKLSRNINFV